MTRAATRANGGSGVWREPGSASAPTLTLTRPVERAVALADGLRVRWSIGVGGASWFELRLALSPEGALRATAHSAGVAASAHGAGEVEASASEDERNGLVHIDAGRLGRLSVDLGLLEQGGEMSGRGSRRVVLYARSGLLESLGLAGGAYDLAAVTAVGLAAHAAE